MITPIARIPAVVGGEPVMIVGFDATHCLCVFGDGHLAYVEHADLSVIFFRDLEAGYWFDYGRSDDTDGGTAADEAGDSLSDSGGDPGTIEDSTATSTTGEDTVRVTE